MGYRRFLLSIYIVISYKRPRIPADSIVPKKSTDGDGSKKIRGFPADQTTVPITIPHSRFQDWLIGQMVCSVLVRVVRHSGYRRIGKYSSINIVM